MRTLVMSILDVLFPKSDDEKNVALWNAETFQKKYVEHIHTEYTALSSFRDQTVRSAIHLNKYHNHVAAQTLLATLVQIFLKKHSTYTYIVLPIPLSKQRLHERGHNQVTSVLSKAITATTNTMLKTDILVRHRHTLPQTTITKEEREKNLTDAFSINPHTRGLLDGAHILLFDDVVTTGATFREAKKAILECNPKSITCIAFSH